MSEFEVTAVLTTLIFAGLTFSTDKRVECPQWPAPEIHGIHLGMSVKQVKLKLPFLEIPAADKYDVRETSLFVTTNRTQRRRLPRVFQIEMWFLKERLVRYNVQYYGSKWRESVSRFVNRVVSHFNLAEQMRVSYRMYECGDVSVSVGEENRRTVSLRDLRAEALLDSRVEDSYRKK